MTPRIGITGRGENSLFDLDGSVTGEVYNKFEEFNEISTYRFNGNINYNPSKILRFRLRSFFIFTPSAETEVGTVILEGGEEAPPVTVAIIERTDRYRLRVSPSMSYSFTTRLSTTLEGNFRTTQYSEDIAGVSDSTAYSAGGRVNYEITRRTTGGLNLSFSDIEFEEEDETDAKVFSVLLSMNHRYTENITLLASGGTSYISQENADSEFDLIGSAETRVKFKNSEYRLGYNRSVQEGSFGETITRDRMGATALFPLSRKMRFRVDGSLNRSVSSDGDEDLLIWRIAGRIDYTPLEHLSLFLRGSSENQDERALAGEDIKINRVTAGFVLRAFIEGSSINE